MLPDYGDGNGMFLLALRVDAFVASERFGAQIEQMERALTSAPRAPDAEEILLPGELEQRTRAQRLRDGVLIAPATWTAVGELAAELGVDMPR
jgi:LDH2 family malate/lactate/ureidoglycolate dehydrogenase